MSVVERNNMIYGTVKECVEVLANNINWSTMSFPEFDFCVEPYDDITPEKMESTSEGCDLGSWWHGCRNVTDIFGGKRSYIVLLFGYWGGGGASIAEISCDERGMTDEIVKRICKAIEESTGELTPDSVTLFDLNIDS